MRQFTATDPNLLEIDERIILTYIDSDFNKEHPAYCYLLLDDNYLLWARNGYAPPFKEFPSERVGGTYIEFPKAGLPWFINTINQKFLKTEAEGGLQKGAFTDSEVINGEKLAIKRKFGVPGYGLMNFSRKGHGLLANSLQEASFTDIMLFDNGLFEQLSDIAHKIEQGLL